MNRSVGSRRRKHHLLDGGSPVSAPFIRNCNEDARRIQDIRQIRRELDEPEELYQKRLSQAIFRSGNVPEEDEKISFYTEGVSGTVRVITAQHLRSIPRTEMTFERLCHFDES